MNIISFLYKYMINISVRSVMFLALLIFACDICADEPDYFYFECTEGSGNIKLTRNSSPSLVNFQYSYNCNTWEDYYYSQLDINSSSIKRIYFRAKGEYNSLANSTSKYHYFTTTPVSDDFELKIGGNLAYLLDGSASVNTLTSDYAFYMLFGNCSNITDASDLVIPFETLSNYCFCKMFSGCVNLKYAPQKLNTKENANNSCDNMFSGCTSLEIAPQLPATILASSCYFRMFDGCTSLETAPELPATTLASMCYMNMFEGCTSLTTAPDLPAENLVERCYDHMFHGCSQLSYINASFLDEPSNSYTSYWVQGVANKGVFVKNPNATWTDSYSRDELPPGWTVSFGDAFAGGLGTAGEPYLISNKQQMANLQNLLSGRASFNSFTDLLSQDVTQFTGETNFKLTTDLDYSNGLSYYSENGTIGAKYLSGIIGTNADPSTGGAFTGVFDGDNHTIAGIKGCHFYEKATEQFADDKGLFYDVNGAKIKNLAVVNSYNIFGKTSLSGNVTFENCYFSFDPQKTRYKSSTDSYTAIGKTDDTYSSKVTLTNCYWADYATKSSTKEQGTVIYSSDAQTSNSELWQKDEVSMMDRYILKSMAVTLTGDDGKEYVTDKLMLQSRTNTLMKAREEDKCGLEFKYNVYTVDAEHNEATIQNLYLNDYSMINKNGWVSKFAKDDAAILSTNLIFNNTYNKVHLKAVHHERVVNVTANGMLTKEQPVTSANSWMSFCLPYSVSKMYGYYFKGINKTNQGLCFAKLKNTTDNNQPADAFMVNAKDLVYTNEAVDYIHVNGMVSDNTFTVSASRTANGEDIPFTMNDRSSSENNFVGVFKTETGANLYPQNQNIFTYKISGSGVINKTTEKSWIYPFRTYLRVLKSNEDLLKAITNSKSATSMFFDEDEVTAVREVEFSGNSLYTNDRYTSPDDEFYTVSGMKIGTQNTSLKPGFYLNGRSKIAIR